MSYGEHNLKVMNELEALVEKLGYGVLDMSLDLHNKKITASTVFGKKRNRYAKNNDQAVKDVADRLYKSVDGKETATVTFVVNVRNGSIDEILWLSKLSRKYEDAENNLSEGTNT